VGPWPLASWDCEFESRREYEYLSVVSVVCCQVEVSASGLSPVHRPFQCGACECERDVPWPWGQGEKKRSFNINMNKKSRKIGFLNNGSLYKNV